MYQMLRVLGGMLVGASVAGCVVAGVVASKLSPPPTTPAAYKPAQQPTLVMVENYQNPDLVEVHAERLNRDISNEFTEHKVAPVVPPQQLMELKASKGEAFARMDIPAVAKSLGARQVIYVDLVKFSVGPPSGSDMVKGEAEALVKVVDENGQTLWPRESSAGRQVKVETPYLRTDTGVDEAGVREQIYQKLADHVARLFYDAPSDEVDGSEP